VNPTSSIPCRAGLALVVGAALWGVVLPALTPAHAQSAQDEQPEEGRVATVVLHDGQVINGTLVEETDDAITLLINGIRTTLPTSKIRESYIQPPIEERYKAVRATIDDDDAEALVQLARWLMDKGRHDLAIVELDGVLKHEPFNDQARSLRVIAEQNIKLQANRNKKDDEKEPDRPKRPAQDEPDFPLLTPEDVNLIRVWEINEKNPPSLTIPRETMEAVIEKYAGHPRIPDSAADRAAILAMEPADQLRLLFALQAREFYPEVQVHEDPEAIRIFRDQVQKTWLRNACATTRCHGGTEAGRFRLVRSTASDPEVYYTNMYIIEHYRTDEGFPLLDFQNPADSLLLKMCLPRRETDVAHPLVRGWRPVFRSEDDRNYRRAVDWIDALWTPRPDYEIDYDPPSAMEPADPKVDGSR